MAASRALSATAAPRMQDMDSAAQERLRKIDAELDLVKQQLRDLQARRRALEKERAEVLADQQDERAPAPEELIDYHTARFPWLSELLRRAQTTFGISAFRLCQEGVCNAVLDQRDVMVVMPTGGGKSLCYQLPALLCDGMVLVVSPLIALMTDQVYHLRARDIPCALLSSAVPKEDAQVVLEAVRSGHNMPKLLYVTPERLAKSKTLLSALQCAYEAGRLARVVIDEAHCCSMMGHDYRPDYHKLSLCRKLFPQTPIMGLTATLSRQALHDVLDILGLRAVTDASHAHPRRTVYFRAPLHRPNLHYRVRTRAAGTLALHESLCAYILGRHAGASGIVYCLSRKDTHTIADALQQLSGGQIRTSVYHSDLDDAAKHDVHAKWRTGEILVVCATIAFGMGIDKGDVRFVVHACIPKSLDGYYQETGRAGYVLRLTQSRRADGGVCAAVPPRRPEPRERHDGKRGARPGEACVARLTQCTRCWTMRSRPSVGASSLRGTLRSRPARRAACATTASAAPPTRGARTCRWRRGRSCVRSRTWTATAGESR